METGDRVIATEELGGGLFGPRVPKGTQGVVVEAGEGFLSAGELKIRFESGELLQVPPSKVARI